MDERTQVKTITERLIEHGVDVRGTSVWQALPLVEHLAYDFAVDMLKEAIDG